jgi:hypothetical protein
MVGSPAAWLLAYFRALKKRAASLAAQITLAKRLVLYTACAIRRIVISVGIGNSGAPLVRTTTERATLHGPFFPSYIRYCDAVCCKSMASLSNSVASLADALAVV